MNINHNQPYGPSMPISEEIDKVKYRQTGEDFYSKVVRIADALKDDAPHFEDFKERGGGVRVEERVRTTQITHHISYDYRNTYTGCQT